MKPAFSRPSKVNGISMIEVLLVVAILAILFLIAMRYLGSNNLPKARDAKRKDDLQKIKIAYEEYYNDNSCYPPATILSNCGGSELSPYLRVVPCDPLTKDPYVYAPYPSSENTCGGYRVYSPMEWRGDPVIEELGCVGGCGLFDEHLTYYGITRWDLDDYQYGISEGVPVGYTEGNAALLSGYCCEVPGDDCQAWNWENAPTGCGGLGPYATLDQCYSGPGGCNP